jgi:hypothetical protein
VNFWKEEKEGQDIRLTNWIFAFITLICSSMRFLQLVSIFPDLCAAATEA